jgi:Lon protease-like protein
VTPDRQIPLFPLPLVLFPRCVLPLHIFEPRYRAMLADCLASDREFGVVALAAGRDERQIAQGTVGCIAHVERAQALPDGRSNILVSGRARFELVSFVDHPAPYHVAMVREVHDIDPDIVSLDALAAETMALFGRVAAAARSLHDSATPDPDLPQDPALLSFGIGHVLDFAMEEKQRLLASRSPSERLRQLTDLLAGWVDDVERRAAAHTQAKQNGHGPKSSLGA